MRQEYLVEVFDKEEGKYIYLCIGAFNKNEARRKASVERFIHVTKRLKNRSEKSYRIGKAYSLANEIKYDRYDADYDYFGSALCVNEGDIYFG